MRAKTVKQSNTTIVPAAPVAVAESKTSSAEASAVASSSSATASSESENVDPQDKENVITVFPVKNNFRSANSKRTMAATVPEHDDLDSEDIGDILMVSDYVVDIFDYMRDLEVRIV